MTSVVELLAKHAELEEKLGDGDGGNFISGWQCINPWRGVIAEVIDHHRRVLHDNEYLYTDRFPAIEHSFSELHSSLDGRSPQRIIFGSGSTVLLLLIAAWLATRERKDVFYVAPMYFTLHSALKLLGLRSRPVNGLHPYEHGFSVNLPKTDGVLILTDPVWYSGTRVPTDILHMIREWQSSTNSLTIVDGSFQYMGWSPADRELTADLDPSTTIRVICPTKQLAMHGYRASYMLVPSAHYREILTLHSHLFGSLSTDTIAFFLAAARLLLKEQYRHQLADLARVRHDRLRQRGLIDAPWEPCNGYFCFERITAPNLAPLVMDGSYFEQFRYPGFARINLLSPQLKLLSGDVDIAPSVEFDKLPT